MNAWANTAEFATANGRAPLADELPATVSERIAAWARRYYLRAAADRNHATNDARAAILSHRRADSILNRATRKAPGNDA